MNKIDQIVDCDKYLFYIDNKQIKLYDLAEKLFGDWYSDQALEFMSAMWVSADTQGGKAEYSTKTRKIRGFGKKPKWLCKDRTIDECYELFRKS